MIYFHPKNKLLKGISVVIPNYNGRELLEKIIPPAFVALQNSGLPFEIIISDDASSDESVSFLKNFYPEIILIQNQENQGFSKTINRGIFKAKFSYILLLNSDVILTENYFENQLRYFDDDKTFGVMGRIVGWNNDKIQDGAKYPNFHGAKIKTTGNYLKTGPQKSDRLYSMYLSGANAFVSKEKILQLQGFDELFSPFYVEDYELSLRAWRMGWKCYYDHFSVCRHKESVSIKSANKMNYIKSIYYRNKMYLHAIHLEGFKRIIWFIQMPLEVLIQTLIGKTYQLKGLRMFLKNYKRMLKSRNHFESLAGENILSVTDVVKKIKTSLENLSISRF